MRAGAFGRPFPIKPAGFIGWCRCQGHTSHPSLNFSFFSFFLLHFTARARTSARRWEGTACEGKVAITRDGGRRRARKLMRWVIGGRRRAEHMMSGPTESGRASLAAEEVSHTPQEAVSNKRGRRHREGLLPSWGAPWAAMPASACALVFLTLDMLML